MKTKLRIAGWLILLALSTLNSQLSTAFAQGTAFTYQGRLQNNGSPASGTYSLTFTLFNTNTSGVPIAGPVTNNAVGVTNGLFTVTIDFGPGAFNGASNWLEIAVATNGVNTFTTLAPRQQLTPVPYAIYAESAGGLSGTLSASQLTSLGNANGGYNNFFVGPSGNSTTSGSANTAVGVYALSANTSGYYNTANGNEALSYNTTGSGNTANGGAALIYNTSGSYNTAMGLNALFFNTSGSYNTANGFNALFFNTVGTYNTANGVDALYLSTNGLNNTAIGYAALESITSGNYNIALGSYAGYSITNGSYNIDIGNVGLSADNNIIRIGSIQSQTFIAGVITGNGGGLTSLDASQLTSLGNTNGGANNFFVGPSGNSTTTGSFNTANGVNALASDMTGNANTANGYYALSANTNGSANVANGLNALRANTSGSYNTADGTGALNMNTTGSANTAYGYRALLYALNGSNNIALGYAAGTNFTSNESSNIVIGNPGVTGDNNTIRIGSGQSQTFIAGVITGNGSGLTNLVNVSAAQLTSIGNTNGGSANFFVGQAGNSTTSGSANTANGLDALNLNTSGSFNTANGLQALGYNTNGSYNTANGYLALVYNSSGSYNTADGFEALCYNTSGSNNIALGDYAGFNITTGSFNIDIGNWGFAGDNNIIRIGSGQTQTFIAGVINGNGGGLTNLDASQLTSIGNTNSLYGWNFFAGPSGNSTMSGWGNTAIGFAALESNTNGNFNTANGYQALFSNTNGSQNTADGMWALEYNTSGSVNTADGAVALIYNTSGSANTANGAGALTYNTNGFGNTAVGYDALVYNRSGSGNIALGYEAGWYISGSSNIDIGNQGVSTDNNIIRIGTTGTQTATFVAGIYGVTASGGSTVYVNSSGQLGTTTSSRRFKEAIQDMGGQSDVLLSLRPVAFRYKPEIDPQGLPQFGLVAEEVEQVDPDLVVHDKDGKPYSVRYEQVNAMLLNEFLKERRKVEQLESRLQKLEQLVNTKSGGAQ